MGYKMIDKLSQQEIEAELEALNTKTVTPWKIKDAKLNKTFVFSNFVEAFGFMTKVAIHAEKQNHHPEWFNVYKTVVVDLMTHEASGVSERDFKLASVMEKLVA